MLDYDEKDPIRAEKLLLKDISKVLLEHEVWVAHFGRWFDTVFINSRLLYHRLPTMPPNHALIDTWKVCKNQLKLRNNRLITLQDFLKLETSKNAITPECWIRGLAGDEKSLRYISKHCRLDVDVLVEAYQLLRPLISDHPMKDNLIKGACPVCGGTHIQRRGLARTKSRVYPRYQCQDCGKWLKDLKPIKKSDYVNL